MFMRLYATALCLSVLHLPCTKLRPRPDVKAPATAAQPSGGGCGDDVCLPVFTEQAIFPVDALADLEHAMGGASSTRPGFADCAGKDNRTLCYGNLNPNPNPSPSPNPDPDPNPNPNPNPDQATARARRCPSG